MTKTQEQTIEQEPMKRDYYNFLLTVNKLIVQMASKPKSIIPLQEK